MLLGSKPGACIRLNRNGTRCQHNISELLRFCGFQGLWKFPYSKRGELVAVAFRVRRSDKRDARRLGAAAGRYSRVRTPYWPVGIRRPFPGNEKFRRAWGDGKNRLPAPGAELCPENARIVLQRIATVDSDENKALVRWRGVRLEPSSTISNGI